MTITHHPSCRTLDGPTIPLASASWPSSVPHSVARFLGEVKRPREHSVVDARARLGECDSLLLVVVARSGKKCAVLVGTRSCRRRGFDKMVGASQARAETRRTREHATDLPAINARIPGAQAGSRPPARRGRATRGAWTPPSTGTESLIAGIGFRRPDHENLALHRRRAESKSARLPAETDLLRSLSSATWTARSSPRVLHGARLASIADRCETSRLSVSASWALSFV